MIKLFYHQGTPRRKGLIVATFLALMLGSMPLHSDRIAVIGDSWARRVVVPLREVLAENGHPDIIVALALHNCCASDLRYQNELNKITSYLNAHPDTNFVHLSIGGNDLLRTWWAPDIGTPAEAELFASIVEWAEIIVDHIFSIRPDIQIIWSSYDYFRPKDQGTPTQLNAAQIQIAEMAAQLAEAKPGLSYVNLHGKLQVTYGFDGVMHSEFDPPYPIPPGDPSLPDASLPSPEEAFDKHNDAPSQTDPLHPHPDAFKVLAQDQYDQFYEPLLNELGFQINSGLNDAWYNPATNGQGFLITIFPDSTQMFVAWFTFDTERPPENVTALLGDPGHRWLTAQGPYEWDTANLTIYLTEGGVFDAANPAPFDPVGAGTMTIEFADCTEGLVQYEITSLGISGEIPIQRITPDNVVLCEALAAQ